MSHFDTVECPARRHSYRHETTSGIYAECLAASSRAGQGAAASGPGAASAVPPAAAVTPPTGVRQGEHKTCRCGQDIVKEREDDPWFHNETGEERCEDSDDFAAPKDDDGQEADAVEWVDRSWPHWPRTVTQEHLDADQDHTVEGESGFNDDISDHCSLCGLSSTSDGKRHGADA